MLCEKRILPRSGGTMDVYVMDNSPEIDANRIRPAVVICPGGGYAFRSFREAEPVALRMLALGMNAFVLHYDVAPARYPTALHQAAEAVETVRSNAAQWHTDPNKIAILGFSAGGHLAASLGVFWQTLPQGVSCRPDAMILCYPVISSGACSHRGSFQNLLGENYDALRESVSLEKRVTKDAPPAFIWHTWEDGAVPVENSLLFASALRQAGAACELHIWQRGCHGMSLSSLQVYGEEKKDCLRPECSMWPEMAARWLTQL